MEFPGIDSGLDTPCRVFCVLFCGEKDMSDKPNPPMAVFQKNSRRLIFGAARFRGLISSPFSDAG